MLRSANTSTYILPQYSVTQRHSPTDVRRSRPEAGSFLRFLQHHEKVQLFVNFVLSLLHQVQHAKRTQSLAHLPPFQAEIVRAVTREVRDLDRDVTEMLEPFDGQFNPAEDPATACSLLVRHLCMRRNKRCLLAYHRVRSDKIEDMCWNGSDLLEQIQQGAGKKSEEEGEGGGGSGTSAAVGGVNTSSLSPEEAEYARQYSDLLAAYKGQWTDIDLTGSLEPPRDLFIDVRVLKDAGEIQTEYG